MCLKGILNSLLLGLFLFYDLSFLLEIPIPKNPALILFLDRFTNISPYVFFWY